MRLVHIAAFLASTTALVVGCSSGSGNSGSSTSGFGCSLTIATIDFCYVYTNLSSDQQNAEQMACKNQMGTVVTSCPTDKLVGCCNVMLGGMGVNECYYSGTADSDKSACTQLSGSWSTSM
jgi:hypothetical protein